LGEAINVLVSPLIALGHAIGNGFDSFMEWSRAFDEKYRGNFSLLISDIFNLNKEVKTGNESSSNWLSTTFNRLGTIVNFLDPTHEKFFLRVAFVPDKEFMNDYTTNFEGLVKSKLAVFGQLSDTFEASFVAMQSKVTNWEGIKIDLKKWGAGEVEIVSGTAMAYYGEKMRFWIGGLMYFLTGAWLIRKLSGVLGEGR
jgi:hypothetical protein